MRSCLCRTDVLGVFLKEIAGLQLCASPSRASTAKAIRPTRQHVRAFTVSGGVRLHASLLAYKNERPPPDPRQCLSRYSTTSDAATSSRSLRSGPRTPVPDAQVSGDRTAQFLDLDHPREIDRAQSLIRDDESALLFGVADDSEDVAIRGILDDAKYGSSFQRSDVSQADDTAWKTSVVKSRKDNISRPRKHTIGDREHIATSTRPAAARLDPRARPTQTSSLRKQLKTHDKRRSSNSDSTEPESSTASRDADFETVPRPTRERPQWALHKEAMRRKFGASGWNPPKKLSPDSLNGIRALHDSNPELYSTAVLAAHMRISPEAVRRILKSQWRPKESEIEKRRQRWEARGVKKRQEIMEHKERRKIASVVRNHDMKTVLSTIS